MDTPLLNGIRKQAKFGWGHVGGILGGLGALSSVAYASTSLKDRHDRLQREKRMIEMQNAIDKLRMMIPASHFADAPVNIQTIPEALPGRAMGM